MVATSSVLFLISIFFSQTSKEIDIGVVQLTQLLQKLIPFNNKLIALYLFELLLALFVGSRDLSVGTDTLNYANRFFAMENCGCFNLNQDLGFQLFAYLAVLTGLGVEFYFSLLSLTLFVLVNIVVFKIVSINDGKNRDITLSYIVLAALLVSPFFVSSHINAIRQGIAAFFIFYAFLSFQNREWARCAFISLIAISIHYTSVMYIVLLGALFIPLPFLLGIISLLSVLYAAGGSEPLIAWISELSNVELYSVIKNYQQQLDYKSGVRYDFLLFSLFWAIFTFTFNLFLVKEQYQKVVELCLKIYVILLIPFLLFGFANFSNRYVYSAWLFAAIMVATTVYFSTLWDKVKRFLPLILLSAPIIFIVMVLNGFAR